MAGPIAALRGERRHAINPIVTLGRAQIPGDAAGASQDGDAARAWDATRHAADIQFAPLGPEPKPETADPPRLEWLQRILEWITEELQRLGRLLGLSWPVMEKVLIALAVALALFVLWRVLGPLLARWRDRSAAVEAGWQPDAAAARALLEDADRLAGEGRFDEATRLLLRRSVEHIEQARPGLLHPASTAREIARLPMLPDIGREAFAIIAARVERSLFALRPLDRADWTLSREAYARFAGAGWSA